MTETITPDLETKFMVDPYLNWVKAEGALIHHGATLDLLSLDLRDWTRFGMKGAVCHVDGRCDFLTAFLFELSPHQQSVPQKHVYEEVFYALAGTGKTLITLSSGEVRHIEWGPKTLFAVPVNAKAQHTAGSAPARFVSLNNFRYLMGLYRNESFLFGNGSAMTKRQDAAVKSGLSVNTAAYPPSSDEMSAIALADMSLGVDLTALAPKSATLARRQMQGRHILGVDGIGYSLSFANVTSPILRTDWQHGTLSGLTGMQFHQHVNAGATPARFISVELGSHSSPMFRSRRAAYGDNKVYASGAAVIPKSEERAEILKFLP